MKMPSQDSPWYGAIVVAALFAQSLLGIIMYGILSWLSGDFPN